MKCDKLQQVENPLEWGLYYDKNEVDAAIAELKAENERLKKKMDDYHLMSDIRRSKIKELKRALWLARAERARDNSILLPSKFMRNVWDNVERKCLKKAEEYK